MQKRLLPLLMAAFLASLSGSAAAVVLDSENKIQIALDDGTQVIAFGESIALSDARSNRYHYLPTGLRLSARPDGTPEFLFLKYVSEQRAEQGGLAGGLMHFLVEWGLDAPHFAEAQTKLEAMKPGAKLIGPADVEADGDSGTFQIISATLSDNKLTPSVVTSGKAPLVPGGKAAAAARLSPEGAQLLAASFEKTRSIADVSLAMQFAYSTLTPAAKGYVTFNWSRLEMEGRTLEAKYKQWQSGSTTSKTSVLGITLWSSTSPTYSYSYDEMQNQWKFLVESKVVDFRFDQTVASEQADKVRDAFFQYFLNSMTEPADEDARPAREDSDKDKEWQVGDIRKGNSYTFKKSSLRSAVARKTQTFNLTYRMAIKRPLPLVGNLASWYDGVRDNPKCVAAINLNDPFFQHRDIRFILDLDAKDIFEEMVNYVTVNVRKKRGAGRPFEDRLTIDKKFVTEKGIAASLTYARGEDNDPDLYEYQAQWSLRGGKVFPPTPTWQKGRWESVTLAAPVVGRTIEVEADLDALKASEITRVTVQIHYQRFGEETEENIQISPVKGEPLVAKKIFLDRDAKGYAYRLVLNHQREGKLALPWSAQVGDDYIYAAIPEDLLIEAELKGAAKEAAKTLATSAKDKVLDQFKDLLGGGR